jgi:signal transduction histidine kinase
LRALARRSPIPVSLDVEDGRRFPEATEAAIYYVVSESLANATKHSRASEVTVKVRVDAEVVRATVADDGVGGAVLGQSSGLVGLVDRVEALGGTFTLESPIGCGTMVDIELPLDSELITDGPSF